jgi:hypothetical protein
MIIESQIRAKLARYLHGEIALSHFEDWLVQESWNMHADSDEGAQALVAAIELRLAEYSSEHLDEMGLRAELAPFVAQDNVNEPIFHNGHGSTVMEQAPGNSRHSKSKISVH